MIINNSVISYNGGIVNLISSPCGLFCLFDRLRKKRYSRGYSGLFVKYFVIESPVGDLWVAEVLDRGVRKICSVGLRKDEGEFRALLISRLTEPSELVLVPKTAAVALAFDEYFSGKDKTFDNLKTVFLWGTLFQRKVWETLKEVKYADTESYKWLAARVGKHKAYRAAGTANGANPIPIIFPCHRIICSNGGIGGYNGGIEIKQYLLELEAKSRRV